MAADTKIEDTLQRVVNLTRVLALLLLLALGLNAFQFLELRSVRAAAYERCVATAKASSVSSSARRVEIVEFRRLGELALVNPSLPAAQQHARRDSYNRMADALQLAVDAQLRPSDCGLLK